MFIHNKISKSIDMMLSNAELNLYFYGEFCLFINFKKDDSFDTCGVNVNMNGMNFIFNTLFLDNLEQEEVNFVVIHEILHLLWDHQYRTRRGGYNKELSNVAQDMIINYIIKIDIIDKLNIQSKKRHRDLNFAKIPIDKATNEIWCLMKPDEYKGNLIFEELYEWLMDNKIKYDDWLKTNKTTNCPVSKQLQDIFNELNSGREYFMDNHLIDDVPEDYRRSLIEEIKHNLKARGILTGDIQKTLDKITKSKKDYIKNIKIGINDLFGDYKFKSISKRNRRSIDGLKGKRKEHYALNVILDVSGSMDGYLEKSLSYVFQNGIKINLIQCDAEVTKMTVLKNKSDFNKIKIDGFGGTDLQPAIDYIINSKFLKILNTLILTDGLFYKPLDVIKLKKCTIITQNNFRIRGKARQIIIK